MVGGAAIAIRPPVSAWIFISDEWISVPLCTRSALSSETLVSDGWHPMAGSRRLHSADSLKWDSSMSSIKWIILMGKSISPGCYCGDWCTPLLNSWSQSLTAEHIRIEGVLTHATWFAQSLRYITDVSWTASRLKHSSSCLARSPNGNIWDSLDLSLTYSRVYGWRVGWFIFTYHTF